MKLSKRLKNGIKNTLFFASGFGLATIINYEIENSFVRKETAKNIFSDIRLKEFVIKGNAYIHNGWSFSPGGGFFYYPGKISEGALMMKKQKVENDLVYMNQLSKEIDEIEKNYSSKD